MRVLHTMIRVGDLERSIGFYTGVLGMKLLRRKDYPDGKFTLEGGIAVRAAAHHARDARGRPAHREGPGRLGLALAEGAGAGSAPVAHAGHGPRQRSL